jgi:tRNA pseudouridine13 synthase
MKLKQRPDDFVVKERTDVKPGETGEFAFYQLEKQSIGTAEAIQAFCKQLRVDSRRVRYGGLKDRHAVTVQFLTIAGGPRRHLREEKYHLRYLGQVEEPYGPQSFSGNEFAITLRDLDQKQFDRALAALEDVRHSLIGNYFDDQRFGSVSEEGDFVARLLIAGDDEKALRLALAAPYEFDRSQEKRAKQLLRKHWGEWDKIVSQLPRGPMLEVVSYLAKHPDDFRGAFPKIPFFLRNMYLSAYQSEIWNRTLTRWMTGSLPAERLVTVQQKRASLPMPARLSDEERDQLKEQTIPLPSSRLKLSDEDPLKPHFDAVLAEENLTLSDMKLKHYDEPFFSRGDRPAFYVPEDLKHEIGWDKLNKGHRRLRLMFALPRGSYATLLVKRITAFGPWSGQLTKTPGD